MNPFSGETTPSKVTKIFRFKDGNIALLLLRFSTRAWTGWIKFLNSTKLIQNDSEKNGEDNFAHYNRTEEACSHRYGNQIWTTFWNVNKWKSYQEFLFHLCCTLVKKKKKFSMKSWKFILTLSRWETCRATAGEEKWRGLFLIGLIHCLGRNQEWNTWNW